MTLPTYEEIARRTGSPIPPPTYRVTRSGIRKYLMATSGQFVRTQNHDWFDLWSRIGWTRAWLKALHIEIPPHLWAEEQARLAAKLAQPSYDDQFNKERERALRWTRRRSPR